MEIFDVIVVGLGVHGSATLSYCAEKGLNCLGIEQFSASPHSEGSSHGYSRVIRQAYFEDPKYVPLLQRAFVLWNELNEYYKENYADIRMKNIPENNLMYITGGLMIGNKGSVVIRGTLDSVKQHDLPHEILSSDAINLKYPFFNFDSLDDKDDIIGVFENYAGFLIPELCISAMIHKANSCKNCKISYSDTFQSFEVIKDEAQEELISVKSSSGKYLCKKLVLSVGPWANEIYGSSINKKLSVQRRVLHWIYPKDFNKNLSIFDSIPIYIWDLGSSIGSFYGFPLSDSTKGMKVAMHSISNISETTPNSIIREVTDEEVNDMKHLLRERIPSLSYGDHNFSQTCMYTMTEDEHFIIDFHPSCKSILLLSPCSGHGFKFGTVIGEIAYELISQGTSRHDISLFSLSNRIDSKFND